MAVLHIIANGKFRGGARGHRLGHAIARLRQILGGEVEVCFTGGPGEATVLSRRLLLSGAQWLAVAGGDGTINEVANGFFDHGSNIRPDACLSILPSGSGNDLIRTLGIPPDALAAAKRLERPTDRALDVGWVRFRSFSGEWTERVFLNVAEAGIGAKLVSWRARGGLLLKGRLGYRAGSLALAIFEPKFELHLRLDSGEEFSTGLLLSMIAAGGRYFGGGMLCAPMASLDDGSLEAITLGDFSWWEVILKIRRFFSGRHLAEAKVRHYRVRTMEARSDTPVFFELDGEPAGLLPATIRLLPAAIKLRY
jgi:diacylglycerol kinase (ATP)